MVKMEDYIFPMFSSLMDQVHDLEEGHQVGWEGKNSDEYILQELDERLQGDI